MRIADALDPEDEEGIAKLIDKEEEKKENGSCASCFLVLLYGGIISALLLKFTDHYYIPRASVTM